MNLTCYDCFRCELPIDWCAEEDEDNLLLYAPNGNGAMVLSFFNALEVKETLDEQISIMAKRFVDQNQITLCGPFVMYGSVKTKLTLCGVGKTDDNWYIKLWIVSKFPKIIFITYQAQKQSAEVKKCDAVVESIEFVF